jgi:hypothetical protein
MIDLVETRILVAMWDPLPPSLAPAGGREVLDLASLSRLSE